MSLDCFFNINGFGSGILVELIGATIEIAIIVRLLSYFQKKREDKKYLTTRVAFLSHQMRLSKTYVLIYLERFHMLERTSQKMLLDYEAEISEDQFNILFADPYPNYTFELQKIRDNSLSEFVNATPVMDDLSIKLCSKIIDIYNRESLPMNQVLHFDRKQYIDGMSNKMAYKDIFKEVSKTVDDLEEHLGMILNHQKKIKEGS